MKARNFDEVVGRVGSAIALGVVGWLVLANLDRVRAMFFALVGG